MKEKALRLLHNMLRVRRLEEKSAELYSAQKIRGFLHLYIGEEAVAAGLMEVLEPEDALVGTYREHGHALLKGMSAGAIMAEMYGKQEGCARGRGGSMHLFDAGIRFCGGNAIVGGHLPVAVGLALADKMLGRNRISCCVFGDGAMAEGEFHESMNLASLWKLPVFFLCENNLYAMGTALELTEAVVDLSRHGEPYGVESAWVDGMDVRAVEAACRRAADHIKSGQGPYFLEARTYRFRAHSMFDAELYRDKDEVEKWRERDPITTYFRQLKTEGLADDADWQRLEQEVAREVDEAVAFAEAGTWEPVEELERFVYSEAGCTV